MCTELFEITFRQLLDISYFDAPERLRFFNLLKPAFHLKPLGTNKQASTQKISIVASVQF